MGVGSSQNVSSSTSGWQSVPKPWTGDSEAPVAEPGIHPM